MHIFTMHYQYNNETMKASDFIFTITEGLFFSSIYLIVCFLASYLSLYWEWDLGIGGVWLVVGFTTYGIIFDEYKTSVINILGAILNVGLVISCSFLESEPRLWIYIVINTIICINIITTCIKNR